MQHKSVKKDVNTNRIQRYIYLNRYRLVFLTIGHFVNNHIYFILSCIIHHLVTKWTVDFLETFDNVQPQHVLLYRHFVAGFRGDAVSRFIYWRYRLINKAEMVTTAIGNLCGGALFGFVYFNLLGQSYVAPPELKLSDSRLTGLPIGAMLCQSPHPVIGRFYPPYLLKVLIFHALNALRPVVNCNDVLLVEQRVIFLFKCGTAEFILSLIYYLFCSINLVCKHVCNHWNALFPLFRHSLLYIGNFLLLPCHGDVTLDASTAVMRYFANADLPLFLCRVLCSLAAAAFTCKYFNTCTHLPRETFERVNHNVRLTDLHGAVNKGDDGVEVVESDCIKDDDIRFTEYPNSALGRFFSKLEAKLLRFKTD